MTEKKIAVTPMFTGHTAILFFINCQRWDYNIVCFPVKEDSDFLSFRITVYTKKIYTTRFILSFDITFVKDNKTYIFVNYVEF